MHHNLGWGTSDQTRNLGALTAMAIVVPVRNEQELLPRFVSSLTSALKQLAKVRPSLEVRTVFGLDRCLDRSAEIVIAAGFDVIASPGSGVGAARRTATQFALRHLADTRADAMWLAHSDADSMVPPNWLTHQAELADAGADVVIGSVRPVMDDLDAVRAHAWLATHSGGQSLGHVHGANLGVRATAYQRAGGFEDVCDSEDVQLVDRARAAGARIAVSDVHAVTTSGRLHGRTGGGYAGYLRNDLLPLARASSDEVSPVGSGAEQSLAATD